MFDHNNEHLHDEFSPGQLNYRKREMNIQKWYIRVLVTYISVYSVLLFPFVFVFWREKAVIVKEYFNLMEGLLLTFAFCRLFYLMRKLHNLEF